ncbi:MAG TPA: hypothetical protein VKC90_12355 [Chitinophagaceae bacterium]|nr:hypothetical protein [Chitinophagaceae bacterium]
MKKSFYFPGIASFIVATIFCLQGCLKDTYQKTYTYTYYKPVYKTTDEVRANIKSSEPADIKQAGKIYIRGQYIFLNDVDKGIHIIDNSNPAQPKNIGFINIPGNMDLAVKGNTLYADLYTALIAIDITDPHHIVLKKVIESVFPHRYYNGYFTPDSTKVIASWEKRDTTVTEKGRLGMEKNAGLLIYTAADVNPRFFSPFASSSSSPYGAGGSMARFTLINNTLYTVGSSDLNVFNISNLSDPAYITNKNIGWNIETIYPFQNKLFIGSTTGMFIYDVSNPSNPKQEGQFSHFTSCDPVIADGQYAYATLRTGNRCNGFVNELDVIDINNLSNPVLKKSYNMTNPHGLSKDGNILFVCDGNDGLKIYNAANATNLQLIKTFAGIDTYDVIAYSGIAIVVAKDGLYQYDYSDINNINLLSKITIEN